MKVHLGALVPLLVAGSVSGQGGPPECTRGNVEGTNRVQLAPGIDLQWTVEGNTLKAAATLSVPLVAGWLAVGFADKPESMSNADVVISENGGSTISHYALTSESMAGVLKTNKQMVDGGVNVGSGKTVLMFTMPLAGDANKNGINVNGPNNIIYAYGMGPLTYHGQTRGSVTVDFSKCPFTPKTPPAGAAAPTTQPASQPVQPQNPPSVNPQTPPITPAVTPEPNMDNAVPIPTNAMNPPVVGNTPAGQPDTQDSPFAGDPVLSDEANAVPIPSAALTENSPQTPPSAALSGQNAQTSPATPNSPATQTKAPGAQNSQNEAIMDQLDIAEEFGSGTPAAQTPPATANLPKPTVAAKPDAELEGISADIPTEMDLGDLDKPDVLPSAAPTPDPTTPVYPVFSSDPVDAAKPTATEMPSPAAGVTLPVMPGSGVPGMCASKDPAMQRELQLSDKAKLQWSILDAGILFKLIWDEPLTNGWISMGFAEQPSSMAKADAVIGFVGQGLVEEYALVDKTMQGLQRKNDQNGISNMDVQVVGGSTILQFQRLFDAKGATVKIAPTGQMNLIFARGNGPLGYHSPMGRAYVSMDLSTCVITGGSGATPPNLSGLLNPTAPNMQSPPTAVVGGPGAMLPSMGTAQPPMITGPTPVAANAAPPLPTSTGADQPTAMGIVSCTSKDGDMKYETAVDSQVTLRWRQDEGRLVVRAVLHKPLQNGWFSIGFAGRALHMTPSDAVVGFTNGTIVDYTLTAADMSGVVQKPTQMRLGSGSVYVVRPANQNDRGSTVLEFAYPMGGKSKVKAGSPLYLIYAFNEGTMGYHGRENRGSITLDLASCQSDTPGDSKDDDYKIHGILMFVAWGVLAPMGIFVSRFMKPLTKRSDNPAMWFYLHALSQLTVVGLSIGGLVIAINMVDKFKASFHTIAGFSVLGMSFIQPIISVVRPAPKQPGGQKSGARAVWEIIHKNNGRLAALVALAAIASGLKKADAADILFILFLVWCGVLVVIFIVLTVVTTRYKANGGGAVAPYKGKGDGGEHLIPMSNMQSSIQRDNGGPGIDLDS